MSASADKRVRGGLWSWYIQAVGAFDRRVARAMGALGAAVARWPVCTVAIAAVSALGCSSGLLLIQSRMEVEVDKLWAPQHNNIWLDQERYLRSRLGVNDFIVQMIFEADGVTSDALSAAALRDMFAARDAMSAVTVTTGGRTYSWENGICWKTASGSCKETGLIRFFGNDKAAFERVAAQGPAALRAALSVSHFPDGGRVTPERLFAGAQHDSSGALISARMAYYSGRVNPNADPAVMELWHYAVEGAFWPDSTAARAAFHSRFTATDLFFFLPRSVISAVDASITGAIDLVAIAVVVICTFVSLVFFRRDAVFTRSSLALLGCLCIALSIGSGFGLSFYLGVPFTSVTQVLPFILLGIGVDDLFVILRSLEEVNEAQPGLPAEERFRKALSGAGTSITVTSVSNIAAFAAGSLTRIPAIRWFCWTAAISIAMDWVLQLTFFLGCLVLTERRIAAGRYDFLCCWKRTPASPPKQMAVSSEAEQEHPHGLQDRVANTKPEEDEHEPDKEVASTARPIGVLSSNKDSWLQLFLNKYLFSVVYSRPGRAVILSLATAGIVLGCVGVTRLKDGLPLSALAPDGHYLRSYITRLEQFQANIGPPAKLFFRDMEQSEPAIQLKMAAAYEAALDADYISRELSPATTWLSELQAFAAAQQPPAVNPENGTVRQDAFYGLLDSFLQQVPVYKDSVFLSKGPGGVQTIEVSSFDANHAANPGHDTGYDRKLINNMHSLQARINRDIFAAENAAVDEHNVFFLFGDYYKFFETNRIIFREMLLNLGLALLGIAVISALLLASPAAVMLAVACIATVDLFLFAELWLLDIRLNTVSVVILTLAVGLAVDYSLHILHTFLHKEGTRHARAKAAMREIGAAVLLGAASTLLGVVILAGANSHMLRTFFQVLLGTVISGAVVGMFVLPVLLSLVGPEPCLLRAAEPRPPRDAAPESAAAAAESEDSGSPTLRLPPSPEAHAPL